MIKKEGLGSDILFYCKDCEDIVEASRVGNKCVFRCKKCGTKNVAFGTKRSIYGFFRLDDKEGKEKVENKSETLEKN